VLSKRAQAGSTLIQTRLESSQLVDAFRRAHPSDPGHTYHCITKAGHTLSRIDYVFVSSNISVRDVHVSTETPFHDLSNFHMPLLAQLKLPCQVCQHPFSLHLQRRV
jgi:endonuclease/exonuclease/phosphatase family metal-dependent hydrolase